MMRTRHYLDELLGSRAKVSVLRSLFLYPWKQTTPLQIARSAKGATRTPVLLAVKQLEATGILTMQSHGHAYLVKLNLKNAAYPPLEALFQAEGRSWATFRQELKKLVPRETVSCVLFGSVLRGDERPGSDIDLLLILPGGIPKQEVQERLPSFLESYGMPLSWYVLTEKEFQRQQSSSVLQSIRKQHDLIKGADPWPKSRPSA